MMSEPTVTRLWVFTYKRPARMGWPVLRWADAWAKDRPLAVAPKEIRVRVYAGLNGQPIATEASFRGDWQKLKPLPPGTIRKVSSNWLSFWMPGRERSEHGRLAAPDWVTEIIEDAVTRAGRESGQPVDRSPSVA